MAIQLPDLKGRIHIDDSALEKVGNSTQKLGQKLSSTGAALTKGLTVPIIGAGAAGVKMAMDVDRGLREVNTLFGETGAEAEATFKQMQAGVKDLSNEFGVAQDVLTSGLYQAISAGVPRENVFEFMEIASKAAIGGVTDTQTAITGMTATLNAFGLDASQAQDVADSMFTTVKGGVTTFEELSANMGNVAPAAAAAGVGFKDVNAALATLTSAFGGKTAEATTKMRAALVELTQESGKASQAFQEISGKTFPEFIKQGGTLQEAIQMMAEEADATGGSLLDMFGSVEAGQAALILGTTGAEKFSEELENQANSAGAATQAFEEMEKSGARKLEKAMTRLKNSLIDVGNVLIPLVTKIIDFISKMANAFSNLNPAIQKVVVVVGGFVAAIGPVMWIVGKLLTSFGTLIKVVKTVGLAFKGLALILAANPFVLLIAAVAALAYIIWKNWDTIKRVTLIAWNAIKDFFAQWWPTILAIFTGGISLVIGLIVRNWDAIKAKTQAIWNAIKGYFQAVWSGIQTVFRVVINAIVQLITGKWNHMKSVTESIWNAIRNVLQNAWAAIKSVVLNAAQAVINAIANAWSRAKSATADGWNAMKGAVSDGVNRILDLVRALPGQILSALGGLGGLLVGAGRALFQGLWDGAKAIWNNNVKPWLAAKAREIRDLKGPIEKDRKLLTPQGEAIIEGLLKGMKAIEPELIRTLTGMTDRISDTQIGAPDLVSRTAGLGDRIRGGVAQTLAASGPASAMAGGNTYNLYFDGTWDLTNPNQAYDFGEKVVRIIQRVEAGKS